MNLLTLIFFWCMFFFHRNCPVIGFWQRKTVHYWILLAKKTAWWTSFGGFFSHCEFGLTLSTVAGFKVRYNLHPKIGNSSQNLKFCPLKHTSLWVDPRRKLRKPMCFWLTRTLSHPVMLAAGSLQLSPRKKAPKVKPPNEQTHHIPYFFQGCVYVWNDCCWNAPLLFENWIKGKRKNWPVKLTQ